MAENTVERAVYLGRAIQARRGELGVKRPELAKRADLSYPYVSEIENGMKMPSTKALGQLAEALDLSITELMGRAETIEAIGEEGQQSLDPAFEELYPQRRLFRAADALSRSAARSALRAPGSASLHAASEFRSDQRLEELIRTIVRAELAAWARTELPDLVRAELERIVAEDHD